MNKNGKRCVNFVTIFGSTVILGALLMVGGCGDGDSAPTATKINIIPAASVTSGAAAGSITVAAGQTVTAQPLGSAVNAISIPAGVTITPPAGTTFSAAAPPTIAVTTFNSLSAMPLPSTAGFRVDAVAGAVDIKIGSAANGVTFTGGSATIKIPLTGAVTNCEVFVNKNLTPDAGYVDLGPALNKATCTADGFATFNVSNLCTFAVDPHFTNGITGSTGTSGGSF